MKKTILVLLLISLLTVACEKDSEDNNGNITISPLGSRILSEVAIRKIDRIESSTWHFDGGNYATETTIMSSTDFSVDPGDYYVFFRYMNSSTGSTGWWKTTTPITVAIGERWKITYGYSGAEITKQ